MLRGMRSPDEIRAAVDALPLAHLREALGGIEAWVVGGVIRDLLRDEAVTSDIDVAIDGELAPVLTRLGAAPVEVEVSHERFATATVRDGGLVIDLARTRRESYAHPGALPVVEPAGIAADLARRDFTINAMAVPLSGAGALIDPYGGAADLLGKRLRVLHDRSFADDPTRAIRAARYAARYSLEPGPGTLELLRGTDLGTVSGDRRRAELARLAAEPTAPGALRLLADWGVLELGDERLALVGAVAVRSASPPWSGDPSLRAAAIMLAVEGGEALREALALAAAEPERPSAAVRLAAGRDAAELLVAAAAGAGWATDYVERWCQVRLTIGGEDLIAAGIPEGPAIGAGLRGALERKLDGELDGGRAAELELALELARRSI